MPYVGFLMPENRFRDYITELPLFFEVLVFFLLINFVLRQKDIRHIMSWVKGFRSGRKISREKLDALLVFVDFILHNIKVVKNTCLNRSITLFHFLNRMGEPVVIHFGVKKKDNALTGHGWLTRNGEVFLEKNDISYSFKPIISFATDDTCL